METSLGKANQEFILGPFEFERSVGVSGEEGNLLRKSINNGEHTECFLYARHCARPYN